MTEPSEPPRAFSIAFGWIGLVVGGLGFIMYWGATSLPERGSTGPWLPDLETIDLVLMVVIPIAVACVFGRWGTEQAALSARSRAKRSA